MAVRGITGALMAGPMKSPELTPFPFEQALSFQKYADAKGAKAMQDQSSFVTAMDNFSSIPGTEEVGEFYTSAYTDKANQIIDNYGGDMTAAANELQNLYFDFERNMTDDMRAQGKAVSSYQAQQAALSKGVAEGKFSSSTAAAMLNQQTNQYSQSLNNYGTGEGSRPTGAIFNRRPIDTPNFQADLNKIRDDIKPDTIERAGYDVVERPDGKKVFVQQSTKQEYSFEEAREEEALKALMADKNYIDYASEQYNLGLMGSSYGGQKYLELAETNQAPVLSADPYTKQQQIASYGAKDEAEYNKMRNQNLNNLRSEYNKNLNVLMDNGYTREDADLILGKGEHDNQQITGILRDIAGGASVGAYSKQTLSNVKFPDKNKSTESTTEDINPPRTATTPSTVVQTPKVVASSAQEKIIGLDEDIKLSQDIINNPQEPQYRKDQAEEDIENYNTAKQNAKEDLANAQFAQALEAIGLGDGVLDGNFTSLEEETVAFDSFVNENIKEIIGNYTDLQRLRKDGVPIDSDPSAVAQMLRYLSGAGLDDAEWDTKIKEHEENARKGEQFLQIGNGAKIKVDNLLGVARDIRDQFSRIKQAEGITRTYNKFENFGEVEENRIADRGERFIARDLNILSATTNGLDGLPASFMEEYSENISSLETELKGLEGYTNAIISPKITPTGDILNGEPVFILDMGYYKPGPTQDAIPIPESVLTNLIDDDSETSAMLSNATDQRRFAVLLPDQSKQGSELRGFIDDQKKLAKDLGRDDNDRASAATTAVRMEMNLDYGALIQKTGIETSPSEVFAEDDGNNTYGYVNRKIPNSVYKDYIDADGKIRNSQGNVILDISAGEHMRIEKTTTPDNQIVYQLYPYKGTNEKGRDVENRIGGLTTSAASMEDLLFRAFDGASIVENLLK